MGLWRIRLQPNNARIFQHNLANSIIVNIKGEWNRLRQKNENVKMLSLFHDWHTKWRIIQSVCVCFSVQAKVGVLVGVRFFLRPLAQPPHPQSLIHHFFSACCCPHYPTSSSNPKRYTAPAHTHQDSSSVSFSVCRYLALINIHILAQG